MKFSVALLEELSRHDSKAKRSDVASSVYHAMVARGFHPAIVNDRAFEDRDSDSGRVFWMRRNNGLRCWEIA